MLLLSCVFITATITVCGSPIRIPHTDNSIHILEKRQTLPNYCTEGCKPARQLNYKECCGNNVGECITEEDYCTNCTGATFSNGKKGNFCLNCDVCIVGQSIKVPCNHENDTKCSDCAKNYYENSATMCAPCSSCEREVDCKECKNTGVTTFAPIKFVSVQTESDSTTTTSSLTSSLTSTLPPTLPPTLTTSSPLISPLYWLGLLVPGIFLPLFYVIKRSGCLLCWTEKAQIFCATYCPCCCGKCNKATETTPSNGNRNTASQTLNDTENITYFSCCPMFSTVRQGPRNNGASNVQPEDADLALVQPLISQNTDAQIPSVPIPRRRLHSVP